MVWTKTLPYAIRSEEKHFQSIIVNRMQWNWPKSLSLPKCKYFGFLWLVKLFRSKTFHFRVNVNVNVEVYSMKSLWVQQTLQFTPLVLELSLIRSHLLWGEFSAFSAADAIHNFSNFRSTRYPSLLGRQRRYGMRGFAQHLYTSINFSELGNGLIYHVLPLVWEIVRRTNRLGTRLCDSCMSTWRRHFWCTIVQPLLAVCLVVCGVALSPPGNERGAPAW